MQILIPIIISIWVAIKSIVEIIQIHKSYNKNIFIENSVLHTLQHLSAMYGFATYGILIPLLIIIGGFKFSPEWIPVQFFINCMLLYVIEHFADERVGVIKPTRIRDIFWIRKRYKKESLKN